MMQFGYSVKTSTKANDKLHFSRLRSNWIAILEFHLVEWIQVQQ